MLDVSHLTESWQNLAKISEQNHEINKGCEEQMLAKEVILLDVFRIMLLEQRICVCVCGGRGEWVGTALAAVAGVSGRWRLEPMCSSTEQCPANLRPTNCVYFHSLLLCILLKTVFSCLPYSTLNPTKTSNHKLLIASHPVPISNLQFQTFSPNSLPVPTTSASYGKQTQR